MSNEGEPAKPMTRLQLVAALRGFKRGETVMDITLLSGKKVEGVVFVDLKEGILHYRGQHGKWPNSAEISHGLIVDVQQSE